MKSDHPIVLRIQAAITLRGITGGYRQLSELTGIGFDRLRKLMSDTRMVFQPGDLDGLADVLSIPAAWLKAENEVDASKVAPPWLERLPSPRAKQGQLPAPAPIADGLLGWEDRLERAWRDYLSLERSPRDAALKAMIASSTSDGEPWPLFHRTVTLASVANTGSAFSWAQQHALAQALEVPGTPPYSVFRAWVEERVEVLKQMGQNAQQPVQEPPPPWPLAPLGECYRVLMKSLNQALLMKRPRVAGKRKRIGRQADPDDVRLAMREVFQHRFLDDPMLTLYEAARQYRAFAKVAFPGEDERAARWPFRDLEEQELWDQLIATHEGHLIPRGDLAAWYASAGLPVDLLDQHILAYEAQGFVRRKIIGKQVWVLVLHPAERPKRPGKKPSSLKQLRK